MNNTADFEYGTTSEFDVYEDGSVGGTASTYLGGGTVWAPYALYWLAGDVTLCLGAASEQTEYSCIEDQLGRVPLMDCHSSESADCDEQLAEAEVCLPGELGPDYIAVCHGGWCAD